MKPQTQTDDSILLGVRSLVARYLLKKRKQRRIHLLEFLACDSSVGRAVDCKKTLAYFLSRVVVSRRRCVFFVVAFWDRVGRAVDCIKTLAYFLSRETKTKKKVSESTTSL